jgi:hypothetical protein
MREEIVKSKVKCPKCNSVNLTLSENYKGHFIEWEQRAGTFDRANGSLNPGDPYQVRAKCNCGHEWTVRGALQIIDIIVD